MLEVNDNTKTIITFSRDIFGFQISRHFTAKLKFRSNFKKLCPACTNNSERYKIIYTSNVKLLCKIYPKKHMLQSNQEYKTTYL